MKPRKVVSALVLASLVAWGGIAVHEILKLNDRVDELKQSVEAKDTELQGTQEELIQADEAYKGLSQQKEQLQSELNTITEELGKVTEERDTLIKVNEAKDKEIKRLKKAEPVSVSRGQNYREGSALGSFEVTWYNDYGHTKSGRFVTDNVTIAVDPNVIPLGSWVKLEFPDGREYIRRADDTGSAVKGNIIDIYDNASTSTLLQRGRTHGVKVTLVKKL
jgi:3D (Asp-Asp-Asp) domain-containing protein